jgi:hypothetical protein
MAAGLPGEHNTSDGLCLARAERFTYLWRCFMVSISAFSYTSPNKRARLVLIFFTSLLALIEMFLFAFNAYANPLPYGVFSLTSVGKPVNSAILTNPLVAGVTIRGRWQDVEPSEGVYDWSYFDQQIARVGNAGKQILLRITSGGKNTPPWVFDAGVETFSFVDGGSGETVTIPVFWDPIFLQKKENFIAAMGEHFAANPNIVLVSSSCANATTDDWVVPSTPTDITNWQAVGYTSAKLIGACKTIIDVTIAAFPQQYTLMAIGRSKKGLDPNVDYVAEHVLAYTLANYPMSFIAQMNSLSARTWDPWVATQLHGWQMLYDYRPMVAGQMLWYVTDDLTCRMNGKIKPCDPVQVLRQAVTIGAHYEMLYQEIYQKDILNPELAGVIEAAAGMLSQ